MITKESLINTSEMLEDFKLYDDGTNDLQIMISDPEELDEYITIGTLNLDNLLLKIPHLEIEEDLCEYLIYRGGMDKYKIPILKINFTNEYDYVKMVLSDKQMLDLMLNIITVELEEYIDRDQIACRMLNESKQIIEECL